MNILGVSMNSPSHHISVVYSSGTPNRKAPEKARTNELASYCQGPGSLSAIHDPPRNAS